MPGQLLRARDGRHARVGFAELFYDLVFVFAITQLSHALLEHQTPLGFLETGMLFLAIWWTWIFTAWVTNWLDPEKSRVRLMLFALMAAGLVVSMSIPTAFAERGAVFAIGFVTIQVGRTLFMLAAVARADKGNFLNFIRILAWLCVSAIFWLWGGFADPHARLPLWGIALAIEYVGPIAGFRTPGLGASSTSDWAVEGSHMAERCGLFIIIALGESVLITGATFADLGWTPDAITAFLSAFIGTIAMWWIYFNIGAERGSHVLTDTDDPGRLARSAYTYLHLPIVAGIIMTAASDEMALVHPHGHVTILQIACLVGGPALYISGNALFKRAIAGFGPLSHIVGLFGFAGLAIVAPRLDALTLSLASTGILVAVAIWETLSWARGPTDAIDDPVLHPRSRSATPPASSGE